jgi:beta-galactosidase
MLAVPTPVARLGALLLCVWSACTAALAAAPVRWNAGWEFAHGDEPAAWARVHLPHDWSIALGVDPAAPSGGNGGFFRTGAGEYRKTFTAPAEWRGRRVSVVFEGISGDATVRLNGHDLGRSVHGYTPLEVDLTPHLDWDGQNTVTVRVDNSAQPNARWYTGSGIYRPVWLNVRSPAHVTTDGVFVTTEALDARAATVRVATTVANFSGEAFAAELETVIEDDRGRRVARTRARINLAAQGTADAAATLAVARPRAWSPESPVLYRAQTRLLRDGCELDRVVTPFGIRVIRVSAGRGFELNGKPVELNGGNVHHDNGVLGAAAFDRAEERKAELLKDAGFNAVRTAHNPPSRAFLAACDRLGLLVVNEIFDGWAKAKTRHDYSRFFAEWWRRDLDAWIRRDRNHPSVVMWSIGNEMFERGSESGRRIARELAARVRELDPTRFVTAGVNGMGAAGDWKQLDPLFSALDVAGLNYELAHHGSDHARLPDRVMMAAESYQNEVFQNWDAVAANSYVIGDFVWAGIDYLGEAGIGRVFRPGETMLKHWEGNMWPWHGAACGDIDLTGWRKPVSHYRNIVWNRGERIFAAVIQVPEEGGNWNLSPWSLEPAIPSWTWSVPRGAAVPVDVYSRCDAVRLELNGKVIGQQPTGKEQQFRARFDVPYEPGELVAVGVAGGREVARHVLRSAGAPSRLRGKADRSSLKADGEDLVFIPIEAVDAAGTWNPNSDARIRVEVTGGATIAGLGSADLTSLDAYGSDSVKLHQGRALLVVRAGTTPGDVGVRVAAEGLEPLGLRLRVVPAAR